MKLYTIKSLCDKNYRARVKKFRRCHLQIEALKAQYIRSATGALPGTASSIKSLDSSRCVARRRSSDMNSMVFRTSSQSNSCIHTNPPNDSSQKTEFKQSRLLTLQFSKSPTATKTYRWLSCHPARAKTPERLFQSSAEV